MFIKTFELNKNNKIELTKNELKQLLDKVYWEGCEYFLSKNQYTYVTPNNDLSYEMANCCCCCDN